MKLRVTSYTTNLSAEGEISSISVSVQSSVTEEGSTASGIVVLNDLDFDAVTFADIKAAAFSKFKQIVAEAE